MDTSTPQSLSPADIKAVFYDKKVVPLQPIKYSIQRESAPLYEIANGMPIVADNEAWVCDFDEEHGPYSRPYDTVANLTSPTAFSRGKRGIAGDIDLRCL